MQLLFLLFSSYFASLFCLYLNTRYADLKVPFDMMGHIFTKYDMSSMLHSMTIRLIHVNHLETFYLCYGVKCQSGVIGVTSVKRSFSLKML